MNSAGSSGQAVTMATAGSTGGIEETDVDPRSFTQKPQLDEISDLKLMWTRDLETKRSEQERSSLRIQKDRDRERSPVPDAASQPGP